VSLGFQLKKVTWSEWNWKTIALASSDFFGISQSDCIK